MSVFGAPEHETAGRNGTRWGYVSSVTEVYFRSGIKLLLDVYFLRCRPPTFF